MWKGIKVEGLSNVHVAAVENCGSEFDLKKKKSLQPYLHGTAIIRGPRVF